VLVLVGVPREVCTLGRRGVTDGQRKPLGPARPPRQMQASSTATQC
jgi:hypothetical protein